MIMINVTKLDADLRAAGIPILGCNSDGTIWFEPTATAKQKAQAEVVLKQHDPAETRAQKLRRAGLTESLAALFLVSSQGSKAPKWAQDAVAATVDTIQKNA